MSENCLDKKMLAISSSPTGPSQLPKAFSATTCGAGSESAANESISDKPAIQIKMVPSSESHQSPGTCKDLIIVNGVDIKAIVVSGETPKKVGGKVSGEPAASDHQVGQALKETSKEMAAKLVKDSLSTCEFSSDDEVMDSSVLQVIDEVGCSSPECPPADVEGVVKQDEIVKVTSLTEPENIGEANQSVADELFQRMTNNNPKDCTNKSDGKTEGDCKEKSEEDGKDKTEDQDDYISLLKKRLTTTESEAEGLGPPSKKYRLDDTDDGQHVTVEVDLPFFAQRDSEDSDQGGKPTRRITKGELQKLVEKLVLEQITASDRSQLEGLKLKCEQLERCSEKWRKKAFTLQKQITEQQILIQRQNLTKKPPYILKPQMRSVGLQVEQARIQQGNMAASNRQPQVALLPKAPPAASVTIRPIGPAVTSSPNKYTVSTNPNTNGISVSILQNRARCSPPGLRPLNTPLPIPNVTVTPSNVFQITNNKVIDSKVLNRNVKASPGNVEVPASSSGQPGPPLPVPMRLIPNQSVARQTSTVPVAKGPSMPTVPGANAAVKFIDLSNDDEASAAAAPANKDKVVIMPKLSGPPNVSLVNNGAGNTISINANCGNDTRALTILTPSSVPSIGTPRKVVNLAPMARSAVAVPITPLRLATAQVTRPVSQQILHSTNIPNGARVTYLVPTSVALVRPPLNGTIVTQPIQRFGQPTAIIRAPVTTQTVLFERRVTGTNVTGMVNSATVSTAPTTIVKTIVAGSPTPSIVTPLATFSKTNAPLIRRLQDECEKAMMQHPAPLPSPHYSMEVNKPIPPAPSLKVSKETNGIVLSWDMPKGVQFTDVNCYQLYAYQESSLPASTSLWKKVGDVKALPLPMACTLTQFLEGHKYHFSVRAVDNNGRIGRFSVPGSIMLASKRPQQPSTKVQTKSPPKCSIKPPKMVHNPTNQHQHFLLSNNVGSK